MAKPFYLELSPDVSVDPDSVIGIFDLDKVTLSASTRAYLRHSEKEGRLKNVSPDIPRSIVVTENTVYFSGFSVQTLKGRIC